jgi:hypothetical protein
MFLILYLRYTKNYMSNQYNKKSKKIVDVLLKLLFFFYEFQVQLHSALRVTMVRTLSKC